MYPTAFAALALASPLVSAQSAALQPSPQAIAAELAANTSTDLGERVLYDHPGDGSLWALGRNWKMSFDADGATYVPFLGSDAPRNYPVRFRLRSLSAGGAELPLAQAGPASLHGDRVEISHGALIESYRLEADSVEQLFELHERVGSSDYELELDVQTELERSEQGGAISFANERGTVSYTRAVAIDAHGERCELDTRLTPTGIRIRVPAAFADQATWPLLIDPVITTTAVAEIAFDEEEPDVAWDETNGVFAVVWERVFSGSDSDVLALFVSGDTGAVQPGSLQVVDTTNEDWTEPSVGGASATDTFLFVATVGPDGSHQIHGRVRGAGSNISGPQLDLTNLTGSQIHPVVGGGRTPNLPAGRFLVVWERIRNATDRDIWGQVLRGDGTPVGDHIPIDSTISTYDVNPAVSKAKGPAQTPWTVVWQRDLNVNNSDIRGARVETDGTIAVPSFEIDSFQTLTDFPVVSSPFEGSGQYLVAYRALVFGRYEIFCRMYQGNSTTPIEALTITTNDGSPDSSKTRPFIDASDCRFVVTYGESQGPFDSDVFATSMSVDGNDLVIEEGYVYLGGAAELASPAPIASTGANSTQGQRFFAVWDQFNPLGSDNDIYGTLFAPFGTLVGCDPQPGTAYCFGAGCPCGNDSPLSGCTNSTGAGALLVGSGSTSIATDDLVFSASGMTPNQPVLLFSGELAVNGGNGTTFGDGLRCTGASIIRLSVQTASPTGNAAFGPGLIALESGPASGDVRRYQGWYRDPVGSPCGSPFNLTNGYEVVYAP